MARLLSSYVQNGDVITADQVDRLVQDLWRIHQHNQAHGDGGQISHGNLVDNLDEHKVVDTHIGIDAVGGSQGVHGLPAGRYVLGVGPEQFEIRWGIAVTDRWDEDTYEQRGKADFGYPRFVEPPYAALIQPFNCAAAITTWYKATQNSVSFKVFIPYVQVKTSVWACWLVMGRTV